jgi:D-alanyl-D-alanine carboxypeptidase
LDKTSEPDPIQSTAAVPDDIPVALRDTAEAPTKPKVSGKVLLGGLAALIMTALSIGGLVALQLQQSSRARSEPEESPSPVAQVSPPSPSPTGNTLLGHFRYAVAPLSELVPVTSDGGIKLRKAAAQAYREMEAAARQSGVVLAPISGFRSVDDQNYLFFGKKAERGQVASERAKVSAPPGYSEHHTGYAIDIGDANVPATNLSPDFDKTSAFRWLQANAAFYSFELSFPKGNKQGVSYEPWHWRYTGDSHSLETFYKARTVK